MADLRTLAQAAVDASAAADALLPAIGHQETTAETHARWEANRKAVAAAREVRLMLERVGPEAAILAALNAADAQGYARAMGEVESAMDAASDEALTEYQARRSDYRDGFCDGLCEAYRIAQNTAKAARERAAAAERLPQHVPQPVPQLHEQADEARHVEQRDDGQRGEG